MIGGQVEHMKESLKINKIVSKEEIQKNLTNIYYGKLMEEMFKQKMPFISSVQETSDYVWGKYIRRCLAHVENGKMIEEDLSVELSSIYTSIAIPKNLTDYDLFCQESARSAAKELEQQYLKGFSICENKPFYGLDYVFDNSKMFYNVERRELRKSKQTTLPKGIFNCYAFVNTLYDIICILENPYNDTYKHIDHIICHYDMLYLFEKMFANMPDTFYNKNGRWILDFNTDKNISSICVNFSTECKKNEILLLNSSTFTLHQLCDWLWLSDEDGKIIRGEDRYNYYATLVKYCNLICTNPQYNAKIILKEER